MTESPTVEKIIETFTRENKKVLGYKYIAKSLNADELQTLRTLMEMRENGILHPEGFHSYSLNPHYKT
ncbi:MAG: hypothetical protein JW791_02195 [Nanoarchaeota archaeon]|nr:hypothetical protein [Nanoarchaeota archaeon]